MATKAELPRELMPTLEVIAAQSKLRKPRKTKRRREALALLEKYADEDPLDMAVKSMSYARDGLIKTIEQLRAGEIERDIAAVLVVAYDKVVTAAYKCIAIRKAVDAAQNRRVARSSEESAAWRRLVATVTRDPDVASVVREEAGVAQA